MGNTVCTDALPPNFHDVLGGSPAIDMTTFQKMVDSVMAQHTHSRTNTGVDVAAAADAVASEGSSEAAATSVAAPWNAYSHVEHNIKAYRLVHRGPPYSARRVKSDVGDGTSVNADELRQRTASGKSSNCGMSTSSAFTPRGGSARTTIKPLPLSALNFTYKRPYATPDPLVSSLLSDPSAANAVEIEPVVLSRPHVAEMKSTETYLVLHIQRVRSTDIGPRTSAHSSSASPLTPHAEDSPTADAAVPSWATEMLNLFTPRGLAVPFASDLERPTVDLRRGRHFRYSLHLLSGRRAHPLVPAVAVLYAIQLEQALNEHPMLLAQLFFNCGGASPSSISPRAVCSTSATGDATPRMGQPRGGALQSEPTSPATIGRIIVEGVTVLESGRNNSLASSPVLSSSLSASAAMDVYARNAVLRVLHGIRNIRGGFPNSGRLSSFGGTPRSGAPTPRSAAGQPKGAAAFRLPSAYQSPSGVVIPPLPLSDESHRSRFHFFDTRKVPPQNSGHTQQSVATSRGSARGRPEGHTTDTRPGPSPADSARDEAIPRTAPIAGMKPLSFQNLGLAGESHNNTPPMAIPSLQLKPKSFGTAASAAPNDTDEREAYEERALRLKLAAPEATEVLPYLFVGGEEAARDRAQLRAKGVTAIVNTVAFDIPNLFPHQFSYLPLYVCDSPDEPIFSLFPLVNAFIESTKEAGGKVMIHCHQGVSRSCSLVIAYLIWKQGVTYDRAYDLVRAKRNICSPNAGFYVNLGLWEKHLSHPSLNKAYALVPYSTTYAFPFTYRLAALFRGPGGNPHAEEDSCNVINAHTQVISDQKPLRIDKRLCYGFMLRDASSTASGLRLSSYFYVDQSSGMHQVLIERAKAQWEQLVLHDFYREEPHKSLNNNGVTVDFVPVKFLPLSAPTKLITSADELGEVLHKHRLSKKKTGAVKLTTRDPLWGDLPDTQEMLANGTTTSAHPSSRVEDAEGSSAEQSGTARKRAREAALNVGVGSQDELPIARPSMKALAIPSAAGVHNNPQEGSLSDVVVYEFPFDQPALTDVIGMADLRLDQAYAVVAPPTVCGSDTDGACRVFLWVGHDFPLHEGDVLDAYEGNLVVNDPSLGQEHVNALEGFHRVSLDGEVVMAFVVGGGLVQEGEEPDELLLELD